MSESKPLSTGRRARPRVASDPTYALQRTVVLIGLMGAGKSAIGRRLASALHVEFVDSDGHIEEQAGMTIAEIFQRHGEAEFRRRERKVIAELVERRPPLIVATGGGAFMDATTRRRILRRATAVWLRADLELLVKRCRRKRRERPLLAGKNMRSVLAELMAKRYPVYQEAPIVLDSVDQPHADTLCAIIRRLETHGDLRRNGRANG